MNVRIVSRYTSMSSLFLGPNGDELHVVKFSYPLMRDALIRTTHLYGTKALLRNRPNGMCMCVMSARLWGTPAHKWKLPVLETFIISGFHRTALAEQRSKTEADLTFSDLFQSIRIRRNGTIFQYSCFCRPMASDFKDDDWPSCSQRACLWKAIWIIGAIRRKKI